MLFLDFVVDVAAKTGIILDPVYTGKTALGLVHELNHSRGRFKGNKILFIHTGKRIIQTFMMIIPDARGRGSVWVSCYYSSVADL